MIQSEGLCSFGRQGSQEQDVTKNNLFNAYRRVNAVIGDQDTDIGGGSVGFFH